MSRITVGIDGSKNAHAAMEWAVDEARVRGADLHLVHTWQINGITNGYGMAEYYEACEQSSATMLSEAVAWVSDHFEGRVTTTSECGGAVEILARAAADSDLLVVGARGRDGFVGLVLGSVASQLAHHAPCPLVIVPATV